MSMSRRIFPALVCAFGIAAALRAAPEIPALDDRFVPGCTLPFSDIEDHHSIDTTCAIDGKESDGAKNVAANEEQNRTKNNFCLTGTPVEVTQTTFKGLQKNTDALPAPFSYGDPNKVPADRSPIRSKGFYTTSNGDDVHEGTLVRTVAFLLKGKYSDTSKGEGVNCNIKGTSTNDIHLALVKSKPTTSTDECQSYTAEISPHFRPSDWLILGTLNGTKAKPALPKIVAAGLDMPLRITGQMMFDASHVPCKNGSGSPARLAGWEIHPVYAIDVCKNKAVSSCRVGVSSDWQSLADWSQAQ